VSTTVNRILYSSATNVVGQITTANSGVLVTSGAGVPSIATDIPTAVTIGGAYVYRIGGTDVVDADVADALTVSGGTIGSNSISGTLTTTGTLTVGDGGDRIDVASDTWDVTNGVITGATYQGNAIGDSYISSASTWNAKAGTGNCAGSNSTHYAVTQNTTTGGVQCVFVPKEGGSGGGLANVVEDTTPQLGGDLDGQTFDFTTSGYLNLTSTTGCSYAGGRATYCWNATETSFCGPSGDEGVCANQ
jgi:hypothetical protein